MTTRIPLMAGNWKMNLNHLEAIAQVQKLSQYLTDAKHDFATAEAAVLVPYTDLRSVQTLVDSDNLPIEYGAQDVSEHASGAYTGDISADMLKSLGVKFCAVGHSERREYYGETDALVNAKVRALAAADIVSIVCVGEALEIRKAGNHVPYTVDSLKGSIADLSPEELAKTVIAYEPVWAIGTGEVATPADAQEVIGALREAIAEMYDADVADAMRILYGGSVKSGNVAEIMAEKDIDGALVGGASLDPEEFSKIVRFADHA
ncbi:MAG: triose-phosphate isomerase [Cellulomonadaceae bacterium]|jgi:triosephosphate isomerase|nr:triose-phosphate isomerase [Cellulomonadaceae bacterium]